MVQHRIESPTEQREARNLGGQSIDRNPGEVVALAQGLYYLLTGVWPLVSIRTFMMVTGPKTDTWLVKTVGVLAAVIGGVLESAGRRRKITRDVHMLGLASAAGFGLIDLVYVLKRRISPVYLLDAIAEIVLAGVWARAWLRRLP